jgi:Domain of unknown function (DUF4157)
MMGTAKARKHARALGTRHRGSDRTGESLTTTDRVESRVATPSDIVRSSVIESFTTMQARAHFQRSLLGINRVLGPSAPSDSLAGGQSLVSGVDSLKGGGRHLSTSERSAFEPRFGQDFSSVRLHSGPNATHLARLLNAKAFTRGADIVFGSDQYNEGSHQSSRLLAHELTHVVQQGASVKRKPAEGGVPTAPRSVPHAASTGSGSPRTKAQQVSPKISRGDGIPRLRRSSPVIQRYLTKRSTGDRWGFCWRGKRQNLTALFVKSAKKTLQRGKPISLGSLRVLRQLPLRKRGMLTDNERMFMAGLLDATNVTILKSTAANRARCLSFKLSTITSANVRTVKDLGRPSVTRRFTPRHAANAIRGYSGSNAAQTKALQAFALRHKIDLNDILAAMIRGASDSTPDDRLLAGLVYAVAAQAKHGQAANILTGQIKVDALTPQNMKSIPGAGTFAAFYVAEATGPGLKGDTLYMKTTFDIGKLEDRATAIHELTHAKQDEAKTKPTNVSKVVAEGEAYREEAKYVLAAVAKGKTTQQKMRIARHLKTDPVQRWAIMLEARRSYSKKDAQAAILGSTQKNITRYPKLAFTRRRISKLWKESVADLTFEYNRRLRAVFGRKKPGRMAGHVGESYIREGHRKVRSRRRPRPRRRPPLRVTPRRRRRRRRRTTCRPGVLRHPCPEE